MTYKPESNCSTKIEYQVNKIFLIPDTDNVKIESEAIQSELMEQENERLQKLEDENNLYNVLKPDNNDDEEEERVESNISKIVSESITKILIVIIMGMIFIIPLLDWNYWIDESLLNYNSLANTLESYNEAQLTESVNNTFFNYINKYYDQSYPILNITFNSKYFFINNTINNISYRREDIGTIQGPLELTTIYYLVSVKNGVFSIINLSKTIFICIMLIGSSLMFEGDANELVLEPLKVMTDIIQKVVNDPIGARNIDAMNIIQENEKQKNIEEKEETINKLNVVMNSEHDDNQMIEEIEKEKKIVEILEEHREVQVIQKSIIKISALLAIGFGEAGADIIKTNLKSYNDLDPMMKGIKKMAFLGFCDIRGFLQVNDALKEDSVIFVNRIAEIVHKSVDKFGGATNKNIGDAFLNVWKFPELTPTNEKYEISPKNIFSCTVADKAVLSFLYIIRAIKISEDILSYSDDENIKKAFPHGYKVNMGFGLHYGWAIEGTVGSKFKIDASYLSPNVNIAARLEAATRQYSVSILISGNVYEFLSDELKSICREIDRVTVKGSVSEIRLFTIDVNLTTPNEDNIKKRKENLNVTEKLKKYLEKKILYKNYFDKCDNSVALNFRTGFFLKNLNQIFEDRFSESFYEKFSFGFDKYIEGKWSEAAKYFRRCLLLNEDDGPTKVLLKYMEEFSFISPSTWKGYRELNSK
jgi:class 3 adenylate cyclase